MATERKISWQARQTWKRLCGWYGADVMERKFGVQPPEDWCEAIDAVDEKTLEVVLTQVRSKYVAWPPSMPDFEQIARNVRSPSIALGPSLQEQLKAFVVRTRSLTRNQLATPWTYLGTGNGRTGEGFAIVGVVVPADGESHGYRVMVEDMNGSSWSQNQ